MGDAALADATVAGLRRQLPNARFIGVCPRPDGVPALHGFEAVSIFRQTSQPRTTEAAQTPTPPAAEANRSTHEQAAPASGIKALIKSLPFVFNLLKAVQKTVHGLSRLPAEMAFMLKTFRFLKMVDLLAFSGSGQLNEEWGGPRAYPLALFRWVVLARLAGCKVAFLGIGAGTVDTRWGKFFCRSALNLAHYVSIRDQITLDMVRSWSITKGKRLPDLAFSLTPPEHTQTNPERSVVALNPITYCTPGLWFDPDAERYEAYVSKLTGFCHWLLAHNYSIHFIPNQFRMDAHVINDIVARLTEEERAFIKCPEIRHYRDILQGFTDSDFVVASRFHGLLFSCLCHTPAITLGFHYKLRELAEEMGIGEYCMDIARFTLEELTESFIRLEQQRKAVTEIIKAHQQSYPEKLEQQFREVCRLIR